MIEEWHKFFGSIGRFMSESMGEHFGEISATDQLCHLLDQTQSHRYNLDYTLNDLRNALKDLGFSYRISLINTTKQLGNEKNTGLDLGITFIEKSFSKSEIRSILVQAKRLYPVYSGGYSLDSKYEAFNLQQLKKISDVLESDRDSGLYLLLNPPRSPFRTSVDIDHQEDLLKDKGLYHCHTDLDQADFYPTCPGTRFSDLSTIEAAQCSGTLSLRQIYNCASTESSFPTFADVMTWLIQGEIGSGNPDIISIAEGKERRGVAPTHTIRILLEEELDN